MNHPSLRFVTLTLLFILSVHPLRAAETSWWPFKAEGKKAEIVVDAEPVKRAANLTPSFSPIVKKAAPSVVNIKTTTTVKPQNQRPSALDDPILRRFFGDQLPESEENQEEITPRSRNSRRKTFGLGSGVIMTKDGYILTNNHVISQADEILIDIPSLEHKEFKAVIVGVDARSDLAVLKIEATDLPAMVIGNSDQVEVGDIVLAIGNPFGLGQTVTQGIVSALGRNVKISRNDAFEDFIQTDASINQGNSGGALVDAEGRLIGINTAIISPNGGNLGIGFAVPINMVRSVLEQIIEKGKVSRGYLGVVIQPVDSDLAASFNLSNNKGALVSDVSSDGGAKKAGIRRGDVITEINEKPIESPDALRGIIARVQPGNTVNVKVIREGKAKNFSIVLAELPDQQSSTLRKLGEDEDKVVPSGELFSGITVENLTPELRKRGNIPNDIKGVLITEIDPAGLAAEEGIRPGFVLLEIGTKPVTSISEAREAAKSVKDKVRILLWNQGSFAYKIIQK